MNENNFSRRKFLTGAAAVGAVGAMGVGTFASCSSEGGESAGAGKVNWEPRELNLPPMLDETPDGPVLKAGVIGCGGRGSGAAMDFLNAGPNLTIVSLGDVFQDRVDSLKEKLKEQKDLDVPQENCFVGFDAYEKVIDSGVDVIILATPPKFRPEHFEAAVKARKHVFMEKPLAVDPVGIRQIIAAAKMAEAAELKVVTGTQRRHSHSYINLLQEINNNAIGNIVSSNIYWNSGQLWYRDKNPSWSEMEWMIRDWVNWTWLSGDHIVEQHIHQLDVALWFLGKPPEKAVGFGSRHRRKTGDQYDNFSVDFIYDDGRHIHSMCRQIDGCANGVYEIFHGTKARAVTDGGKPRILDSEGNEIYVAPDSETPSKVQEHKNLVASIRNNTPINTAEQTAISTLMAIMGRISAYTGKEVTYEEVMNSDLKLGPDTYIMGDIGYIEKAEVPVPGTAEK